MRARRQGHRPRRRHPRGADGGRAQPAVREHADDVHRLEHRPAGARLGRRRRGRSGGNGDGGRDPARSPPPRPARRRRSRQTASHIDGQTAKVTGRRRSRSNSCFGQSVNNGWQAVASPGPGAGAGAHSVNLGPPQLVDGFANGWPVTAAGPAAPWAARTSRCTLTWTPQRLRLGRPGGVGGDLAACAWSSASCPCAGRRWLRARLPRRLRGPAGPGRARAALRSLRPPQR